MPRVRKTRYREPIESAAPGATFRPMVASGPAYAMSHQDWKPIAEALMPPGNEHPMLHTPQKNEPNDYRYWLIYVLESIKDCYRDPVHLALDCLRTSLIEVNRGLTPNLFKAAKPARGGLGNFAAQAAMNLATLAAEYINDERGNEDSYEEDLLAAGTSKIEIDQWKSRIYPAYRQTAIIAWSDGEGARRVLKGAVADAKSHIGRQKKRAS